MPEGRQPGDNVQTTPIGSDKKPSIPTPFDLGGTFYDYYTWSNAKEDFPLDVYFDPERPNLGTEFGLSGLQPVLKNKEDDRFLLKDDENRFYMWNMWSGEMFWLKTDKKDPMEVAMMVMEGVPAALLVPQFDAMTVPAS